MHPRRMWPGRATVAAGATAAAVTARRAVGHDSPVFSLRARTRCSSSLWVVTLRSIS